MATLFRHIWLFNLALSCKMRQVFIIIIVDFHSFIENLFTLLQLCVQICCIQFTWKVRRSIVHPPVFIYLSPEKFTSVSAFFPQNFCFFLIFIIIKEDCSALSHSIILCLMEAVTAKISNRTKRFAFIKGVHSLGRIFNNFKIIFLCNCHDRIHLTGNSGVMNRHDHLGFLRDCCLDQFLINIHCIRSDINKYDLRSL